VSDENDFQNASLGVVNVAQFTQAFDTSNAFTALSGVRKPTADSNSFTLT
jgi:hypothetical protein